MFFTLLLILCVISGISNGFSIQSFKTNKLESNKNNNYNKRNWFMLKNDVKSTSQNTLVEMISQTTNLNTQMQQINENKYELSTQQTIYVILTSIFITCLIISDVIGVKLFEIPLPFEILGLFHLFFYLILLQS